MLTIEINGEKRQVEPGLTVAELLEQIGVTGRRVAVERNREIVPRAAWSGTALAAGDSFEIIELVGGG
ncbi:sulfur carrier protein ThiS [bacterium]|nr:sulfur carrier protein ThiS [bacterium]